MMRGAVTLLAVLAAVAAAPAENEQRIIGGSLTTVEQYPFVAALLYSWDLVSFTQQCAGTIINDKTILTAAHCLYRTSPSQWRIRIGSSYANSGGMVHSPERIVAHPRYSTAVHDYDYGIVRSATIFRLNGLSTVAAGYAGNDYRLDDNETVWTVGWGATSPGGPSSKQLREVKLQMVNWSQCRRNYFDFDYTLIDSMVCAGYLEEGGRDTCTGDSGGPLIHKGIVVGISSWGGSCGEPRYPGIFARISYFNVPQWIGNNAY